MAAEEVKLKALVFLYDLRDQLEQHLDKQKAEELKRIIDKKIEQIKKGDFKYIKLLPNDNCRAGKTEIYNSYLTRAVSYYHEQELQWESTRPHTGGAHVIAQIEGTTVYFPLSEKGELRGIRFIGLNPDLPANDIVGVIVPHPEEGSVAVIHFGSMESPSIREKAIRYLRKVIRHLPEDQVERRIEQIKKGDYKVYELPPGSVLRPVGWAPHKIENKKGEIYLNDMPLGKYGGVIGRTDLKALIIPIKKGFTLLVTDKPKELGENLAVSRVHGVILPHPEKEGHFVYVHVGKNRPKIER